MTQNKQQLDEYGVPIPIRPSTRNKDFQKQEQSMWTRMKNPLGTIFPTEILKAVSQEPLREDKIKMLRMWWQREAKNAEFMRTFMLALYHPGVKFTFPDTRPPFHPNDSTDLGMSSNTIYKAMRKLKLFSLGPDYMPNQAKRENTLIQQLETMHRDEAELYWMIICKQIDQSVYPGVDEDLLREAFAAVLPPKTEEVKKPLIQPTPTTVRTAPQEPNIESDIEAFQREYGNDVQPAPSQAPIKRGPGRPRKLA